MKLTAIICALAAALLAQPKDVPVKTIESIKRSVVPVICGIDEGKDNLKIVLVMGSGFLVNREGDFVTAAHVLDDWGKVSTPQQPCILYVYFPVGGWENGAKGIGIQGSAKARWFPFAHCIKQYTIDVASCRITENPFSDAEVKSQLSSVTFESVELPDGSPVAFTGFPLNSLRPITSKAFVAAYRVDASGSAEIIVDKAGWPGASGSPLYTASGHVIGLIREAGVDRASGIAYARVGSLITQFLKDKKIDFVETKRR